MKMSQIDRFRATIHHEPHDEFLFYARFTPPAEKAILEATGLAGYAELQAEFGMYQAVPAYLRPSANPVPEVDYSGYFTDMAIPQGSHINHLGVLEVPGSSFHFTRMISPLRHATTLNEVMDFPYLDLYGLDASVMADDVKLAREKRCVSFTALGSIYEAAWMIRGYEEFLMDMMAEPEMCDFLLDKQCDLWVWLARLAASAGVDLLTCGDDVANQNTLMFSKDLWRRFIKPRWKRVFDAAKAIRPDIQIKYHSDGNVTEVIDELIEIGVTILNPLQPECMDLKEVKRRYGRNIVFDGMMGTQSTLPFGSADDVAGEVRKIKKDYGYDGAIIIAPSHKIEPEVPVGNVLAFLKACAER